MVRFTLLLLLLGQLADSLKVLMFVPTLSYSHVAFSGHLADLLVSDGHNVTMLIIEIDPSVSDSGSKLAEVIRVDVGLGDGRLPRKLWQNPNPYEDASPTNPAVIFKLVQMSRIFNEMCQSIMENHTLLSELHARRYDVGISEQYITCGFGLFRLVGIRSSLWLSATAFYRPQPEAMGIEYPLSYVPELFSSFSSEMTFVQRLKNIMIAKTTEWLSQWVSTRAETVLIARTQFTIPSERTGEPFSTIVRGDDVMANTDNLLEVAAQSSAIFTNVLPLLDFSSPTANFIKSVAGLTVDMTRSTTSETALPEVWRRVISTNNGFSRRFVLVTFGSIAKMSEMPLHMCRSLFNAFRQFPNLNFIVKYEKNVKTDNVHSFIDEYIELNKNNNSEYFTLSSEVQQVSNNVFLAKWMPQMDLIAHPKCFGIITHGGWSSVLEAVFYARPLILMPLFADHFKNAKVIEHRKLGVLVNKQILQHDTFSNALRQIVDDSRFIVTSLKYSKMLREFAVEFSSPQLLIRHQLRQIFKDMSNLTPIKVDYRQRNHDNIRCMTKKINYNKTNNVYSRRNIEILGNAVRTRWRTHRIPKNKSFWFAYFLESFALIFLILFIAVK